MTAPSHQTSNEHEPAPIKDARNQTDRNLRVEREQADRELHNRLASAQAHTDDQIASARNDVDQTLSHAKEEVGQEISKPPEATSVVKGTARREQDGLRESFSDSAAKEQADKRDAALKAIDRTQEAGSAHPGRSESCGA